MAISWNTTDTTNSPSTSSGGINWSSTQSSQPSHSNGIWDMLSNSSAGQAVKQGGQAINDAFNAPGQGAVERGINTAGAVAGTASNAAMGALGDVVPGGKSILGAIGKGFNGLTGMSANIGDTLGTAASKVPGINFNKDKYDAANANFANSDIGKGTERIATVGQSAGNIANLILAGEGTSRGIQKGVDLTKSAVDTVKNSDLATSVKDINTVAKQMAPTEIDPETAKIQETIAPKLNKAETQAALVQGRISRAPEGGLRQWAFGKSPDTVAASEETAQSAQTIKDNIPGAAEMDDAQLHSALSTKTTELAQELEPKMQAVELKPETVDGITKAWEQLKNTQVEEPEYDAYPGSAKAQAKFEKYLDPFQQKSFETSLNRNLGVGEQTPPSLDDVWHARKDYDASIAMNVKNATTASSPSLQWQKTMWLQNRSVLSAAINDSETGLGVEAQKPFSDMHDMYNAQENILSKVKVDIKGTPGITGHIGKSVFKWGVGLGLGGLGLKEILH